MLTEDNLQKIKNRKNSINPVWSSMESTSQRFDVAKFQMIFFLEFDCPVLAHAKGDRKMKNEEQLRFVFEQIDTWQEKLKPWWASIELMDVRLLLFLSAYIQTCYTDILIRLKNLPDNAGEPDVKAALLQTSIYETKYPSVIDFAMGVLLATRDYLSVAHLIWIRLSQNEIRLELKRRAKALTFSKQVYRFVSQEIDLKTLIHNIGYILISRGKWARVFGKHIARYDEAYKAKCFFTSQKEASEIFTDTETHQQDVCELIDRTRNVREELGGQDKTIPEEQGLEEQGPDEGKDHGEDKDVLPPKMLYVWQQQNKMFEAWGTAYEHFHHITDKIFSIAGKEIVNFIKSLDGAPSIFPERPAPAVWNNRLALQYYKSFVAHALLWGPFYRGTGKKKELTLEKLPFEIFNKVDYQREKELEEANFSESLDQAESEVNEEGKKAHGRDNLESMAGVARGHYERDRTHYRYLLQKTEARIFKDIESCKNPIRLQLARAYAHHRMTSGEDIAGDCRTSGLSVRTWYAFRCKHGLTRNDELSPVQ
jgi:hypothetical protein